MNRKSHILFSILLFLSIIILLSTHSYGQNNEKKVVKIGWFDAPILHDIGEDGQRTGYDYDYLEAIRQYTN